MQITARRTTGKSYRVTFVDEDFSRGMVDYIEDDQHMRNAMTEMLERTGDFYRALSVERDFVGPDNASCAVVSLEACTAAEWPMF